jgi:hypothetical protein
MGRWSRKDFGFDCRYGLCKFSSGLFLLSAFGSPGIHSASNRNKSLEVKCSRGIRLTSLPAYLCRMSRNDKSPTFRQPSMSSRLVTGKLNFYILHISFLFQLKVPILKKKFTSKRLICFMFPVEY